MTTVSRVKAAELAGVDPRTISRWAKNGVLVKYAGPRGDVQFDRDAVAALRKDPDDHQDTSHRVTAPAADPESAPAQKPRW